MTKILIAAALTVFSAHAFADLTAGEEEAAKFTAETPKTQETAAAEASDLKAEIADTESEANVCLMGCHPTSSALAHGPLQHISLNK